MAHRISWQVMFFIDRYNIFVKYESKGELDNNIQTYIHHTYINNMLTNVIPKDVVT